MEQHGKFKLFHDFLSEHEQHILQSTAMSRNRTTERVELG